MLPFKIVREAQLDLVDIQITLTKNFNKKDYLLSIPYKFRTELTELEKEDCYAIAEATSIVSRFSKEKRIGPEMTKKLYRKWIDTSLDKSFSDGLFLDKTVHEVLGIHLIKTDISNKIGYFTLTGVNPNYKRLGIGRRLWLQSFSYWANESNIDIVRSPLSFQNAESFNFHLGMGFEKLGETKYIYHFRNLDL
jgi:ribosomal protein S18 acetylase RimI-like enzyme